MLREIKEAVLGTRLDSLASKLAAARGRRAALAGEFEKAHAAVQAARVAVALEEDKDGEKLLQAERVAASVRSELDGTEADFRALQDAIAIEAKREHAKRVAALEAQRPAHEKERARLLREASTLCAKLLDVWARLGLHNGEPFPGGGPVGCQVKNPQAMLGELARAAVAANRAGAQFVDLDEIQKHLPMRTKGGPGPALEAIQEQLARLAESGPEAIAAEYLKKAAPAPAPPPRIGGTIPGVECVNKACRANAPRVVAGPDGGELLECRRCGLRFPEAQARAETERRAAARAKREAEEKAKARPPAGICTYREISVTCPNCRGPKAQVLVEGTDGKALVACTRCGRRHEADWPVRQVAPAPASAAGGADQAGTL